MRLSLFGLAAAMAVAVFSLGAAPAQAASLPKIDQARPQSMAAEPVGYYRRRAYRPYRQWGPPYPYTYRYARPYRYYYGPTYPRYRYRYSRRPYYGRRYYW